MKTTTLSKCGLAVAVLAVGAAAATALADFVPIRPCFRNVECLDVWAPVICSDGRVYSNDCYAYRACATGCVPYEGEIR